MSQNLTKPNKLKAIELLIVGKNITDVAKEIGVARETVSQWTNHDAEFIAELNTQRHNVWSSFEDRLRDLIPKAMNVVSDELDAGNAQTAIAVLKMASFKPQPIGKTDASKIEMESFWG